LQHKATEPAKLSARSMCPTGSYGMTADVHVVL